MNKRNRSNYPWKRNSFTGVLQLVIYERMEGEKMKTKSKIIIPVLVGVIGLTFLLTFIRSSQIKADEAQSESSTSSAVPKATSAETTKITGAMTKDTYLSQFSSLNTEQNEAWNQKYNFKPETNVVTVSTIAEFKTAFESNNVSKIVLTNDITDTATRHFYRTESIEIDGKGFTLSVNNGSINVDRLAGYSNFTKNFSDVPVFHMHDIKIKGSTTSGGGYSTWAFINGGTGYGDSSYTRGIWQYRIGNVEVISDSNKSQNNSYLHGRLINGNRALISMWGYNLITTGAENFYTGGIDVEPYAYYSGKITDQNFSTIWFIRYSNGTGDLLSTGTQKFNIGEGSFVYLNNTGTGASYPAIYQTFDEINVGKGATYNANVPGTAVSFNLDNAKFIAQEGSTINLLSRSTGNPTLKPGRSAATFDSVSSPKNISIVFDKGSKVNIVGNNSNTGNGNSGVIGSGASGATVTLNDPESFDINNLSSTGYALGYNSGSPVNFTINSSDISLYNIRGSVTQTMPDYTYPNVGEFAVNLNTATATAVSDKSALQSIFTPNKFRRISGLNSIPEIYWDYVTDADYSQRAKVLLGYAAVGGANPFDENGDPIMTNVYADDKRLAQIAFTDTLGNKFTGYSGADQYVTWQKENHAIPGFQISNENISGIPSKVDDSDGSRVPYISGEELTTQVLRVTPPNPIQLKKGKITDVDTQLEASGIEANAKVYMQLNDGAIQSVGTADDSGNWSMALSEKYKVGDKVRIYLENSSDLPSDFPTTGLENTRIGNANRNPVNKTTYRDATFEPATVYVVEKGVITKGSVGNNYSFDTDKISVGSTITYSVIVSNDEEEGSNIKWNNVELAEVLDEGLEFDLATADIKVNGNSVNNATYEASSRTLKVPLGTILPTTSTGGNKVTITFNAKVNKEKLLTTISNTAKASGTDDIGADFERESNTVTTDTILDTSLTVHFVDLDGIDLNDPIVIESSVNSTIDLSKNKDVQKVITDLISADHQLMSSPDPATIVISGKGDHATYTFDGILKIVSAPKAIDFGSLKVSSNLQTVDDPTIDGDLTVSDTRSNQTIGWTLSAKVTEPMTNNVTGIVMPNALKYNSNNGQNSVILSGDDLPIENGTKKGSVNISSDWGATDKSNGVKLVYNPAAMSSGNTLGDYTGTILWTLSEVPKL